MTYLILKSYFMLFLSIGSVGLCILLSGLYFIFKKTRAHPDSKHIPIIHFENEMPVEKTSCTFVEDTPDLLPDSGTSIADIQSIAGDDTFATQLDLARAYIEMGSKQLAKKILDEVVAEGSTHQQTEARTLLGLI